MKLNKIHFLKKKLYKNYCLISIKALNFVDLSNTKKMVKLLCTKKIKIMFKEEPHFMMMKIGMFNKLKCFKDTMIMN